MVGFLATFFRLEKSNNYESMRAVRDRVHRARWAEEVGAEKKLSGVIFQVLTRENETVYKILAKCGMKHLLVEMEGPYSAL